MDGELSFARRIRQMAEQRPTGPAIRHLMQDGTESSLSWPELDRRSSQIAAAFAERGLRQDGRLALALHNSTEFVLCVAAAWRLGAIPVPLRWDAPEWERDRLRAVIEPQISVGPADLEWVHATADDPVPDLPDAVSEHVNGICSSGSTGMPKVILLGWRGVFEPRMSTPMIEQWRPVPQPQRILVPGPMYHTNGFAPLLNLLGGDELFVMERFDAAAMVDAIERQRISTFTSTPTMLQRIVALPDIDTRDLSSIEWFTQGAAPMPPSLVYRWADLVGAEKIVMAYGMTEGLGLTALLGSEWMDHPGSVGRGQRGTEIAILDQDQKEVPVGEIGDIYLRMPVEASYDYLGNAERLRATPSGFHSAGDMGYLDGDGYLYLVDRRVDMIITGGANVFPAEVELALIDHPDVADVAVIGLRDPEWGRRVHAVVQPSDLGHPPTESDLIAFAKARLAAYKVPKSVELVDVVPRSEATKVNRGALVEARGG